MLLDSVSGWVSRVLVICLLAQCALALQVEAERYHRHRHHHDSPVIPPPPFDAEGHPIIPSDAPRFAEIGSGVSTATTAEAENDPGLGVGSNADIVKSIYDLLAKKRDMNVAETSRIMQKKVETAKEQEMLRERTEELKERAAMLTRLQYCLEQDARRAKAASDDADRSRANATASQAGLSADALNRRAQDLDRLDADLRARMNELARREADLRRRWDLLKKQLEALRAERQALLDEKAAAQRVLNQTEADCARNQRFCPGECAQFTKCGECVDNPKCGWCRTSQSCVNVLDNGQAANCSKADLSHLFCKSNMCEEHKTCRQCMSDPDCGRCATNGQCGRGDIRGPTSGTCPAWNYAAPFRFFNLNIYGRDTNNVTDRATNIFAMIEEANADFVMLQEVEDWFLELMSKQRWAKRYHASDFGSGHAPGGLLILSKYPLASVSYYEKTQPGQVEVDQRGHMLVVQPRIGQLSLSVATTELDWRSSDNRADSLEFVFSVLGARSDVVLGGDFNFDFGAQPESAKIPSSYRDVWLQLRATQPGFTWDPIHNSYARASDPRSRPSRIDRLLVKSDYAEFIRVSKVGSPDVSPHYGLLSDIKISAAHC